MSTLRFHEATDADIARLRRMLTGAGVFEDDADIDRTRAMAPWKIQASEKGDLAVVDLWRDHMDLLGIEALWCAERSIPPAVGQLREIARDHGLEGLLSHAVPVEQAFAYEAAGMRVQESVHTYERDLLAHAAAQAALPAGVVLRSGLPEDVAALVELDAACFSDFWRYDARHLSRYRRTQRLVIAESEGTPIGYTLSTAEGGNAVLGRLAVLPAHQRRGVGHALVEDVASFAAGEGARHLTLCTQTRNAAARALYRSAGFKDTRRHFVFLLSA